VDGAMRLYELANADRDRWSRLLDALTSLPDRERLAVEVVERHLQPEAQAEPAEPRTTRLFKAVK